MTRTGLVLATLFCTSCMSALAQPAPFDMTPESGLRVPVAPATNTPAPVQPVVVAPQRLERFLLPAASFRLAGEESRTAMVVYLTEAQANAPARLQFAYTNAVVVAPEISNLSISVNGTPVAREPIASPSAPRQIAVELPAGLLRQGANRIEFSATQRHRTDCSINSTYELWTDVVGSSATLSFEGANIGQVRQLADLAAIGVDATGATTVRMVVPALGEAEANRVAIRLAQQLALALRVRNLHVEQASTLSESAAPGVLDVVLGTVDQLPAELAEYGTQATSAPVTALAARPTGANTLVVSGPDWAAVAQAADSVLVAAPVAPDRPIIDLPDAIPLLQGGESVSLAALGQPTAEFNGRRFTANFQFMLPPDFYGTNYGEAELVLDAAYSSDVQPGSEIDIFTNGQIASATPLLRTDGGLLRNTVIRVPMTNLRPGRNEVAVVVNLNAQSDAICSAGWTGAAPVRFVFSSSTQFRMPEYARAAELPDLQLFTGSAWPYADAGEVPLLLGRGPDVTIAAMTLLARAAAASNTVLPVTIANEAQVQPGQDAIFVMAAPEMSAPTLARSGVTTSAQNIAAIEETAALDQFRSDGGQRNIFSGAADWVLQRVGLTLSDLRVLPESDMPYPVTNGSVVLAQARQPEGGLWTVLTGPDAATMRSGIARMTVTEQWRQVDGRVSMLGANDANVTAVPPRAPTLIQTQPVSVWNLRLVAANWFSGNILLFTAALAAMAVLLMAVTALVLVRVGRQK
ncbi:MAG: hypothetical protein ABS75_14900 [Pelagibacterium sp. SCN 63-23]|nr:MAG: hypothetical protein ABS75_14900 [Pelagibacterium sp. SCN 63-23]